jgi:hypothetical protein
MGNNTKITYILHFLLLLFSDSSGSVTLFYAMQR